MLNFQFYFSIFAGKREVSSCLPLHVPVPVLRLFLPAAGGVQIAGNEHKKSACHSHKENGKRWLVGFVFSFGYGKGAARCCALVGSVRFSVSGWTRCPAVGAAECGYFFILWMYPLGNT